jgi:hypothetical protein
MSKKKKLVIKVNYDNSEKLLTDEKVNLEIADEWDIEKIVITLLLLLTLITVAMYYLFNKSSSPILDTSLEKEITLGQKKIPEPQSIDSRGRGEEVSGQGLSEVNGVDKADKKVFETIVDEKSQASLVAVQPKYSEQVVRSQLTNRVTNNEPIDMISSPIMAEKDNVRRLSYFTELKDMSGKIIYHNWIYKGESVFRKKVNINGNRWRVTTQKKLNNSLLGDWKVTLTDMDGYILDEINFKVINQ